MALARWQATIVDDAGNVLTGASVEVRHESDNSIATIKTDRDGAVPKANPFSSDSDGFAFFHAAAGTFKITATKGTFSRVWRYVTLGTGSAIDLSPGPDGNIPFWSGGALIGISNIYYVSNRLGYPDGCIGINTDLPEFQLDVRAAAGDTTHDVRVGVINLSDTYRAGILLGAGSLGVAMHVDLLMGSAGTGTLGARCGLGMNPGGDYAWMVHVAAGANHGNFGIKNNTTTILHPLTVGESETPALTAADGAVAGFYRPGNVFGIWRNTTANMEAVVGADTSGAFIGCSTAGQISFVISSGATAVLNTTHFMPSADGGKTLGRAADLRFAGLCLTQTGTIDFGNGDIILAGSSNLLTLTGGNLAVPVATATTHVPTFGQVGTVLLNTLTASNSATLVDTTSLTAAFDSYLIEFENVVPATNATQLAMRVTQDGGSNWLNTSYLDASTATAEIRITGSSSADNTAGAGISGFCIIQGVNQTDRKKMAAGRATFPAGGAAVNANISGWYNGNNSAINGLQFLMLSGNISTGKIRIYGMRT